MVFFCFCETMFSTSHTHLDVVLLLFVVDTFFSEENDPFVAGDLVRLWEGMSSGSFYKPSFA